MKQVVTASEMKLLDQKTITKMGVPSLVLMERAALAVVEQMEAHYAKEPQDGANILVVCGSGNNGADGVAIARILSLHGWQVAYTLVGNPEHHTQEMISQLQIARNYGVHRENIPEFKAYTTIVDAIFGVGLSREVKGSYSVLLERFAASSAWKVAVDLPSGIDGTRGKVLGTSYQADLTVTFAYRKSGLCLYPGRSLAGEICVADVGIYAGDEVSARHLEPEDLRLLPGRDPIGNKGTFGKVLVVAGSDGMAGAAYFAAAGALAAGAGMVRIQTSKENRTALQTLLPEAILSVGELESDYEKSLNWCDVVVIGPGIGTSVKAALKAGWFLWKAAMTGRRVVLDADGLNLLAENPQWKEYLTERCILTPHMGEMSRLTGKPIEELKGDPALAARTYAAESGAVCVLKDACTITASPKGDIYYNLSGNAAMATAGSGDVLSGILGALSGLFEKSHKDPASIDSAWMASLGVYLHGCAGDLARERIGAHGVKARDLIDAIPAVIREGSKERP
jgi:NAD(P)H-hydrate epimerase